MGTNNWSTLFFSAYPLNAMTIEKVCIVTNARAIIAAFGRTVIIKPKASTNLINIGKLSLTIKKLKIRKPYERIAKVLVLPFFWHTREQAVVQYEHQVKITRIRSPKVKK